MLPMNFMSLSWLIELVTDAIKFSTNRLITVSGHINGNNYCLSVQHNGARSTAEQIENIFKPLYLRSFSSTAQEEHSLGLFLATEIVEAHGGELLFKSEVGQGTQALMILPLWNECADMANMYM